MKRKPTSSTKKFFSSGIALLFLSVSPTYSQNSSIQLNYRDVSLKVALHTLVDTYELNIVYRDQCKFSFYCDGKSDDPKNEEAFDFAVDIASHVLAGVWLDQTDGATHYHAIDVSPDWAMVKTRVVRIENHIFYRWD